MNNQKSLKKAFEILELFIQINQDYLRLSDITRLSGLKMATANRIAATLVDLGYLSQTEKRAKYAIGKKFIYFAGLLTKRDEFAALVKPYLNKLHEATGETVVLANFDGNKIYFVEKFYSAYNFNIISDPVIITPLYCSSLGKVFLSEMPEPELEEYLKNTDLVPYTKNTITDPGLLRKHLAMVKRESIAYDDEEITVGVRSIASGIKDTQGTTFSCIGIIGPNVRLTRSKIKKISSELKQFTSEISNEIGYKDT